MDFPVHIPFVHALGFELVRFDDDGAELAVTVTERLTNSFHVIHGGVTMTLLDVCMAHAARAANRHLEGGGPGVVTVEMKTSFLRPGVGRLRGVGSLLHRTATMAFTEGRVLDDEGRLVAHATGTFKFVRKLPVDRQAHELRRLDGDGSD